MTKFRPCIDLHDGKVKQIVGGTLTDDGSGLVTNFESPLPPEHFAAMYRRDELSGGHVIMLGKGNESAARAALNAFPGGMQIGGGITAHNAADWLEAGASHVIVTSWLFSPEGNLQREHLAALRAAIGKKHLILDLSCRRDPDGGWTVCMNRWQTRTDVRLTPASLASLTDFTDEFLIHAADVEGKRAGMDEELIAILGEWSPIPVTYAGGASAISDLERTNRLSHGRVDLTIGSALDIFGGALSYSECVKWNRQQPEGFSVDHFAGPGPEDFEVV